MAGPEGDPLFLESAVVRSAANAAAKGYDESAILQAEVRKRLLERLDYVRLQPATILDMGAATGEACVVLASRYPQARIIALDFAVNMLRETSARPELQGRCDLLCADAQALPLASGSVDLIFCNLLLPWCNEPLNVLQECRRVLRPGGLFNFATAGPDTLYEMRAAWSSVDRTSHVHRFIDMHDVGDALLSVGLAEPVLDLEYITLSYRSVEGIMRELKACGAHNATTGRPRGLMGKARMQAVYDAYEQFRGDDGRIPVSCEVIYGQAWGALPASKLDPLTSEASVPLSSVGRRVAEKPG